MSARTTLKLEKKIIIEGQIKLLTGMHIGASSIGLEIGGTDKVVVRNPLDGKPYIPGSSLKGKMRSLLEKVNGKVNIAQEDVKDEKGVVVGKKYKGEICQKPEEDIVQLFGYPAEVGTSYEFSAPTRLIVRDADLTEASFNKLEKSESTDMYLTEIKTETSIDRLTSAANPRSFERVPAGAEFNFQFIVDIYDVDILCTGTGEDNKTRESRFLELMRQAMELIEMDYIGGQGTRGYGQVKINVSDVKVKTADCYINNTAAQSNIEFKDQFSQFAYERT